MLAAGATLAFAPLVAAAGRAEAARYEADSTHSITFVDISGQTATCTLTNFTTHNTDNADQPKVTVEIGLDGSGTGRGSCFADVYLTTKVSYKDKSGVLRTATFSAFGPGSTTVEGTYSPITATVTAIYFNCNADVSATCNSAAQSAPK